MGFPVLGDVTQAPWLILIRNESPVVKENRESFAAWAWV
jgi:hypothetical protein